jgi:peptide/nickel transport system ATP-binding protein
MCDTLLVMNRGKAVETITRSQLKSGVIKEKYTKQLLVAGKGYDRTAIDLFQDFR